MELVTIFTGMAAISGVISIGSFLGYKCGKFPKGLDTSMDALMTAAGFMFAAIFGTFFI